MFLKQQNHIKNRQKIRCFCMECCRTKEVEKNVLGYSENAALRSGVLLNMTKTEFGKKENV